MKTINLSKIENSQNYAVAKSGELCVVELLLRRIKTQKKGRKPTLYYKGMEVVPDVTKDNIERIIYCQHCGYQKALEEGWEEDNPCPICGNTHSYGWEGFRIKGTQHQIYSDKQWNEFKDNFKNQFTELERFK